MACHTAARTDKKRPHGLLDSDPRAGEGEAGTSRNFQCVGVEFGHEVWGGLALQPWWVVACIWTRLVLHSCCLFSSVMFCFCKVVGVVF